MSFSNSKFFEVKNFFVSYGTKEIISNLSFEMEQNEILGILGANGCGKTTLLKAMCGALPSLGSCLLFGQNLLDMSIQERAKVCSYIPQRSGISLDISCLDVVLMGFNPYLGLLESPSEKMKQAACAALENVGFAHLCDANYQTLSEGQKQLVILARTLVYKRNIIFLDEPESALDFGERYKMLAKIRSWVSEDRRGAIVTLHDPQLALNNCDKILFTRGGKVEAVISPKTTPREEIEEHLKNIFGNLSLHLCKNKQGKEQFVLLREEA